MLKNEPQIALELVAIDHSLSAALFSAAEAEKKQDDADQTLYAALHDIYLVWHPLANKEYLIHPFCDRHGLSTHSKLKNRFLAPVQYCFRGKKSGPSHTHYANALHMAEEGGVLPTGLVRWLEINEGPSGLYERRLAAKRSVPPQPSHVPLPAAQPTLRSTSQLGSPAIQTLSPASATSASPHPHLPALPRPTDLVQALIEACEMIHDLTLRAGRDRGYLIANVPDADGKWKCRIENVSSTTHTPFAQVTLAYALDALGNREYLLRASEHKRLMRTYASRQGWNFVADDYELRITELGGHFEFTASRLTTDTAGGLYRLREPLTHGVALTCTKQSAQNFTKWHSQMRGFLKADNERMRVKVGQLDTAREFRRKFPRYRVGYALWERRPVSPFVKPKPAPQNYPRALDLAPCVEKDEHDHVEHYLEVHHSETSNLPFVTVLDGARCRVFDAASPISINQDVRLNVLEVQQACTVINRHASTDARAQFVGYEEAQSGLAFEIGLPDVRVRFVSPTVLSQSGLHRQCSQALIPSASSQPFVLDSLTATQNAFSPDATRLVEEQFAAYITCFRPSDQAKWLKRRANFLVQLEWWLDRTVVPLFLRLSGWSPEDVKAFNRDGNGVLDEIQDRFGDDAVDQQAPGSELIANRIACLEKFYRSNKAWGIMMDDDAIFYDEPKNNSSHRIFAEMALNGPERYSDADVIFPLNPAKMPYALKVNGISRVKKLINGNTAELEIITKPKNAERHRLNHVFDHNLDLKGSMFIVRNFRISGDKLVLPEPSYTLHGEDTYFAILATSMGYKVRRCNNIHLKELTKEGDSYFDEAGDLAGLNTNQRKAARSAARKIKMLEGNIRLAEMFAHMKLRMWDESDKGFHYVGKDGEPKDKRHLLYVDDFVAECLGEKPKPLDVLKP